MPTVTDSAPFNGAATCYRRAYKLLAWMGRNGHVQATRTGRATTCHVDEEMSNLIRALNQGDEETIKDYLVSHRFIDAVHA